MLDPNSTEWDDWMVRTPLSRQFNILQRLIPSSRVHVALDLKAAFQNVSRRAMLHSIEQNDPDLAAVFSKWYTDATEHRMHKESAYTKISANSGADQGCPLSTCGFSTAIDPVLRFVLADIRGLHDLGAKLIAYLDDWNIWIHNT